jgi:hypothetical protein
MQIRETNRILNIASLAALVAAVALSVPVVERLIAAAWQWYKFSGYSEDGHINLSFRTGLFFSGLFAVIFGVSLLINRLARRRSAHHAAAWSLWAILGVVAVTAAYWLLGVSGLNAWRA